MRYVIVGAGPAGSSAAAQLARLGTAGDEILVLESSAGLPPSRVLWPEYAAGEVEDGVVPLSAPFDRVLELRPSSRAAAGTDQALRPRPVLKVDTGEPVTSFSPVTHQICVAGGGLIGYDRLLLATGQPAGRPNLPGSCGCGVHYLDSQTAAVALREWIAGNSCRGPVAVVGAGPAGIRLAQALAAGGMAVTLCELQPTVLPGVIDHALAAEVRALLEAAGITVGTGLRALEIVRDHAGSPASLLCASTQGGGETTIPCRAVVFCTGAGRGLRQQRAAAPETLADTPVDLATMQAVSVDEGMRTGWLDVFAAGDIAVPPGWETPPGLWRVATWQGSQAALAMAGYEGGPSPETVVLTVRLGAAVLVATRPYNGGVGSGGGPGAWSAALCPATGLDRRCLDLSFGGEVRAH